MTVALVVHHVRSGVAALNVVSAALDADVRTAGTEVLFAKGPEELAAAIASCTARGVTPVCGWSFYSTDAPAAFRDLAWVRERAPGAMHVAGGVHATAEPLDVLRAGFDLAAIGEGETTIVAIVDALKRGEDPRALRGTAHLDGRAFVSHGPGERRPLDDFPAFNVRHGKWNPIEITRGCVYACSFCQTPFAFKAKFRHRSVANVVEHVRAMTAGGSRYMRFVTPTCLSYGSDDTRVNLDAVDALLAGVRSSMPRGKIYFGTFPSECRPEHVTREALAVLRKWVDNDVLVIGGQSGSERVLEATRRGHGVDDVVRAVENAVAFGFRPDVDFLFGLPGETREDRDASVRLAERLVGMGARIHTHAFLPLPGTPLRDARPEPIEPDVTRAIETLEGKGASYGQWRKQVVAAGDLVRRRAAAR